MKVILLNQIEKLGKKGDVVNVKRGFARNFLIPRTLALYATPQNMKKLGSIQSKAQEEEQRLLNEMKVLDGRIRALTLSFTRKVDENDHMFGSVSETDITAALHERGIAVHKSQLNMEKHIKALGETTVEIRLHREVISELKINVEREEKTIHPTPAPEPELAEEQLAAGDEEQAEPAVPEIT